MQNPDLEIRKATSKAELYSAFVLLKQFFPYVDYNSGHFEKGVASGKSLIYLGKLSDGRTVGFLHLKIEGKSLKLAGVAVLQEFQRNGFGEKMVEKAFQVAKEKMVERLFLFVHPNNLAAKKLYQKKGFELKSERAKEINGELVEEWAWKI